MCLLRPRISLRWLVIATAFVGLVLGSFQLWRRSHAFSKMADSIASEKEYCGPFVCGNMLESMTPAQVERFNRAIEAKKRAREEYYTALERKYRNAARRPWFLVEPDPPMP